MAVSVSFTGSFPEEEVVCGCGGVPFLTIGLLAAAATCDSVSEWHVYKNTWDDIKVPEQMICV